MTPDRYGPFSYLDAVLAPLARAMNEVLGPKTIVWFAAQVRAVPGGGGGAAAAHALACGCTPGASCRVGHLPPPPRARLQGEMSRMITQYPLEHMRMLPYLK